jgi:hypothetical protein
MVENWTPIEGFEERYAVSDQGRVKSLSFMQRYLLRNGVEAFRRTREKVLSQNRINSGYYIVHLYLDNVRTAALVHRLVAQAYVANPGALPEVNHEDGNKANCRADNLGWMSSQDNHEHAVDVGLNAQARPVVDPATGVRYPSIARAAREARKSARTVRTTFTREIVCQPT